MPDLLALLLDTVSWLLIGAGALVTLTGGIGLLRLPDLFSRTHAASLTDTLGAALLLLGMALQATAWIVVVKLVLIGALLMLVGPVATHALARAALHGGLRPRLVNLPRSRTPTGFRAPADSNNPMGGH